MAFEGGAFWCVLEKFFTLLKGEFGGVVVFRDLNIGFAVGNVGAVAAIKHANTLFSKVVDGHFGALFCVGLQ